MEEHFTERRNLARERIVSRQRGKHVSWQDTYADHVNRARQSALLKQMSVVTSQSHVAERIFLHETMGFVRVKRQGVGGLLLHNMYRRLAKDHFKAVDRIKKTETISQIVPTMVINSTPIQDTETRAKEDKSNQSELGETAEPEKEQMVAEAAIAAVSAANPSQVLAPVRRRKLGTYRNVRTPVFLDRLSELAVEEGATEKAVSTAVPPAAPTNHSTLPSISLAPAHFHPLASQGAHESQKRKRKRRNRARSPICQDQGPFLRLFREEELNTFRKLERRLALERTRLQHQANVDRCAGNLHAWLDRNPAHLKKKSQAAEAILQALKKPPLEV